jgi:alanine racemase
VFVVSSAANFRVEHPEAAFLRVFNSLEALQKLASHHRRSYSIPVIGVTGSNGKTVVKEWLSQLLGVDFQLIRSPKSYNSQLGVPLSVLQLDSNCNLAIFEAGISQQGEMEKLEPIISPSIGIFTNIGMAHQENFPDIEAKANEKIKLFANVETLIYCTDYEVIHNLAKGLTAKGNTRLFTWGRKGDVDVLLNLAAVVEGKSVLSVVYNDKPFDITIPFVDEASVENAMHCICAMLMLEVSMDNIARRMGNLQPVAMRLEQKEGVNGCTIINDSYNSDLGSLSIALDFLAQQRQHHQRVLILSDILQSGQPPETLYADVANLVMVKGVDRVIGVGTEISRFAHLFSRDSSFFVTTEAFIRWYTRSEFVDAAILLKGSRPFRFERISALLEQKSHRTILEIDLNALVSNLNYFRNLLKPNVKVMAMVKAFSYGTGSHEIANLLQFHRVDYLGVAFTDEGIALREAGITLPIVVLNPTFENYDLMIEYNLEPEIFSFGSLQSIISAANKQGVYSYPIHIKIDTGMHRLGFMESDIDDLISKVENDPHIRVQSIFSHLAASDDAELDNFSNEQIESFEQIANRISKSIGYTPIRHILNSAGIERFPKAQFDMVRLGIGLYGISVKHGKKLQVVNSLKSYIAQIKLLPKGQTVGYNRRGVLSRSSIVATIPIGYADGLNRRLSNGTGHVLVNGTLAPIIGNVSMDTCTIDVTEIPNVAEGTEVTIFGELPTIEQIATQLDTIPYEVLTSVSRRVKRVYVQE